MPSCYVIPLVVPGILPTQLHILLIWPLKLGQTSRADTGNRRGQNGPCQDCSVTEQPRMVLMVDREDKMQTNVSARLQCSEAK